MTHFPNNLIINIITSKLTAGYSIYNSGLIHDESSNNDTFPGKYGR